MKIPPKTQGQHVLDLFLGSWARSCQKHIHLLSLFKNSIFHSVALPSRDAAARAGDGHGLCGVGCIGFTDSLLHWEKKKKKYFWILTFFLSFSNFSIPVQKKRIWLLFHSTREFHNTLQSYIKSWKRKQLPTATKMPWCSTYSKQRKHYRAGLFIF